MNLKFKILMALMAFSISVILHGYLTSQYYPLHYGFSAGKSLCNVSAQLDCDAVSASSYSTLLGIPISLLGASYNALLVFLILLSWWGWRQNPQQSWRDCLWLAGGSVLASIVMAGISATKLHNYCLFCIGTYALSLVGFGALAWALGKDKPFSFFKSDLVSWFTHRKGIWLFLAFVPASSFLIHTTQIQSYGANELEKVIRDTLADWQSEPSLELSAPPSLTKGASPSQAKMVIAEFADFTCSHCRMAAPGLSAFVKSHSEDVRLLFYSFPLDSKCNPDIPRGDGVPCRLALSVYCAERQKKGWDLHEYIFSHQNLFMSMESPHLVDQTLKQEFSQLGLEGHLMESCLKDPVAEEGLRAQVQMGIQAKIKGTPTIFVNGKKLERGQLLPVLSALYDRLLLEENAK